MAAIFGSGAGGEGLFNNSLVIMVSVFLVVYVFIKFCSWAKKNKLSGSIKKVVFILTGFGVIGFNIMYSLGNTGVTEHGDWSMATYAVVASLIWAFIFAYALMTEKAE